jgi:hypothetical protein
MAPAVVTAVPRFRVRAIADAAALVAGGATYLGLEEERGFLVFVFADPAGTIGAWEVALFRREAPPVQARDLLDCYFALRSDLHAARSRRAGGPVAASCAPGG